MDLFQFKAQIAASLTKYSRRRKIGSPIHSAVEHEHLLKTKIGPAVPIPEKTVRHDGFNYMPEVLADKGCSKLLNCTGIVRTKCTKCNVFFCVSQVQRFAKDVSTKFVLLLLLLLLLL